MSDIPQAVRVHIASSDVDPGTGTQRRRRRAVYQTVTLTFDDPCQNVLPDSEWRKVAFIVPLDQAVVIGSNQSDVKAGVGTIVPQNVAWPVEDDAGLYAAPSPALAAAGDTARISVQAVYEDGQWLPSR